MFYIFFWFKKVKIKGMKKLSKVKWREIVVEHFRLLTWGGGGGGNRDHIYQQFRPLFIFNLAGIEGAASSVAFE